MKRKMFLVGITFTLLIATAFASYCIHAATYNDWTMINGVKYFYNSLGEQIGTANAKKVIDVSEHQGVIDWKKVKNDNKGAASIDGAIIRISAGTMREDYQLANNIKGAKENGIPIGLYIYSYADDVAGAEEEARFTAAVIEKYGLHSTEFPVYYDLENFDTYHNGERYVSAPTSSAQYEKIVKAYMGYLNERGIYNVQLYSYRSLIQSYMNTPYLLQYMGWIAEYSHRLNFDNTYYKGLFGWQYTSTLERVNGINGNIDVSCFYDKGEVNTVPSEISSLLQSKGFTFSNEYVAYFSADLNKQEANASSLQGLNNVNYQVVVKDVSNNVLDYSNQIALKTGDIIMFQRKDSSNTTVKEYQFKAVVRGDVNGNGKIDAADYLIIMDTILGKYNMNDVQRKASDVNGNGKIDAADYLMTMDHILGKYHIS